MRKRRKLLLALGLCASLAILVAFCLRDQAPTYHGKSLSQWTLEYENESTHQEHEEASTAIHALCSNAIPALVAALEYDGTAREAKRRAFLRYLPRSLQSYIYWRMPVDGKGQRAHSAQIALAALGQDAAPVLPQLTTLAASTNQVISYRAMWILAHMGTNGLPPLLHMLTTQATPYRANLISVLGQLDYLGTNALPAVPVLLQYIQDPDPRVRRGATNALRNLAPEVLTNAPPR
jgi:hypothetical protein